MENNELQKIWKNADMEIQQKSKEELNLLLTSKAKQTIGKFLTIIITSVVVSAGLLIWLIITSLNRPDDLIYLLNNAVLGIVAGIALLSGLMSWYKLQNNKFNQPLKNWLEIRTDLLSKDLSGKYSNIYIFLIPILCILTTLSIHVYFEYKSFIEVFKTEESVIGLIVGIAIGIFFGFYVVGKIRKYQLNNLNFLKDLQSRLSNAY